jgi:hypothetical protein
MPGALVAERLSVKMFRFNGQQSLLLRKDDIRASDRLCRICGVGWHPRSDDHGDCQNERAENDGSIHDMPFVRYACKDRTSMDVFIVL